MGKESFVMLIKFAQKNKILRKIVYKLARGRAEDMARDFIEYLNLGETIIDIGAGSCNIAEVLQEKGWNVTALDVKNMSFVDSVKPIIYDPKVGKMPFTDKQFDVALILTVLHHTKDPLKVLKEAKRIAKKVIVIEDIYKGCCHKHLTYFLDSLLNLEFFGHPHTNKTDKVWQKLFKNLGFKIKKVKYKTTLLVIKQAIYFIS